jgi:hypothetical protein
MLENQWFRLVNNWLHDFSSGLWGACVLVIYLLQREVAADAALSSSLLPIAQLFWWVLLASLAVIAITGAVRCGSTSGISPSTAGAPGGRGRCSPRCGPHDRSGRLRVAEVECGR